MSLYQFVYLKRNARKLFFLIVNVIIGLLAIIGCGDDDINGTGNQPGILQFNSTSYNVTEGTDGFVNIIVTRSGGSDGAASIDYATADGSSVAGSDYTSKNGTLTWTDGLSGNQTISVAIADDNTSEPSESFTVTLSNVSGATLGTNSATVVNITDDD